MYMEYRNILKPICGGKIEPGDNAIHAASDGSYRTKFGVAGWAFTIQKDDTIFQQAAVYEGYFDSLWAELKGLENLTEFILRKYEKHFKDRDIIIYVDSIDVYQGITVAMREWEQAHYSFSKRCRPKRHKNTWQNIYKTLIQLRLRGASIFIDCIHSSVYLRIHDLSHKLCTKATKKAGLKLRSN